ncbi:peptide ABC transporter substrate-binding protein [Anaeroarcus burkinensis]|uniref:peptide ABC transporter substrate-binding protein n=1 Tax=Anaeroarcus burkinensis TaxID=82376 RepID=UPI00040F0B00|nr:peptide ABC transporter substrate-binding protein [Anaeroarcus burkinensis]
MRRFGRIWILALLLGGLLLVGGCSFGQNSEKAGSVTSPVSNRSGGQVVYASLHEPALLNPYLSDAVSVHEMSRLLFSGLVVSQPDGVLQPDLARELPTVSPDGLTIRYLLRTGVTWHDGAPFTAEDVRFTWEYIMNSKTQAISRDGYDRIRAVETPDPYTVVIKFREIYPDWVGLFKTILPKHLLAGTDPNKGAFQRNPIGTGPFRLQEWRMADGLVFVANERYFRGKPKMDTIFYKIVPDETLLIAQAKSGEVDIAPHFGNQAYDQMRSQTNFQVFATPGPIWEQITFNMDHPLFKDLRVRQALALGLDRNLLAQQVLKGTGVAAWADQPAVSWAYVNEGIPPRDLKTAKELLAQAGWLAQNGNMLQKEGKPLAFALTVPSGNKQRELAAQAIVQQWKELGVSVQLQVVDAKNFEQTYRQRPFAAAFFAWVRGVDPDNRLYWHSRFVGQGGLNVAGWRNPQIDALTIQGATTPDMAARKEIYKQIGALMNTDVPVIPLYFRCQLDASKTGLNGFKPNPVEGNLWNSWEWNWATR